MRIPFLLRLSSQKAKSELQHLKMSLATAGLQQSRLLRPQHSQRSRTAFKPQAFFPKLQEFFKCAHSAFMQASLT